MAEQSLRDAMAAIQDMSSEEMEAIRFIDVEASGLHKNSYPIEIAWCGLDLKPVSMLVRPLPSWGEEDWSPEAEKVHGIPRHRLFRDGNDARECAGAMAQALSGRVVCSDAPAWDARWLMRMFVETGVKPGFDLLPIEDVQVRCARKAVPAIVSLEQMCGILEDVGKIYRHTHRAGDDCLRMAAMCRGLYDHGWRRELFAAARRGDLPPL